jgi:hypothetical protein
MIIRFLGTCLVATGLLVSQAQAHGGVSVQDNKCIMKIGPYQMNFTGYQPDKSSGQFCDDIPEIGRTIVVLDAEQSDSSSNIVGAANNKDLRDMNIDFRVLRNVGQAKDEDDMDKNTEVYIPAKVYPTGTLHFEYNFAKAGNYIGLVAAKDVHGNNYVSRFPFAVGQAAGKEQTGYVIGGVVVVGLFAAGLVFMMRRKAAPKSA